MTAERLAAVFVRMARASLADPPGAPMTDDDLMLAIGVGLGLLAIMRYTSADNQAYGDDAIGQLAAQLAGAAADFSAPIAQPPTLPPAPGEPPAAQPPTTTGPGDQIDAGAAAVVNGPDFRAWPIVTTIRSVTITGDNTFVHFDDEQNWPDVVPAGWDGPLNGTVAVFVNVNGQWVGSPILQMWAGRWADGVGDAPSDYARNWYYADRWAPMTGHQIAPGETIAFCVIPGNGRDNVGPVPFAGRSQIVTVPATPGTYAFG